MVERREGPRSVIRDWIPASVFLAGEGALWYGLGLFAEHTFNNIPVFFSVGPDQVDPAQVAMIGIPLVTLVAGLWINRSPARRRLFIKEEEK